MKGKEKSKIDGQTILLLKFTARGATKDYFLGFFTKVKSKIGITKNIIALLIISTSELLKFNGLFCQV
jgi:hypothetical protein